MKGRISLTLMLGILLATVACQREGRRELVLYPTPTVVPTQTPFLVQITTTPVMVVIEITHTPTSSTLCVKATVAVYLRPSPSDQNYPITEIQNGERLSDLGGRNGKWMFVEIGDKQGWVHEYYVTA